VKGSPFRKDRRRLLGASRPGELHTRASGRNRKKVQLLLIMTSEDESKKGQEVMDHMVAEVIGRLSGDAKINRGGGEERTNKGETILEGRNGGRGGRN